jgi:hypothetical protein
VVRRLHRSDTVRPWRSEPLPLLASAGVFMAVESSFQFPFAMAFPALTSAVLCGLALARVGSPGRKRGVTSRPLRSAGDVLVLVVATGLVAGAARLATAEWLQVRAPADLHAQELSCALDPRRLEACTDAAWLHARAGDRLEARRLLQGVLVRSPHYFPAIKLLGEVALVDGDREEGCRHLRRHDALFGREGSLRERADCPGH